MPNEPLGYDPNKYDELLREELGVVMLSKNRKGTRKHFHIPDGDKPLCNLGRPSSEWYVKDASVYPPGFKDWCARCVEIWIEQHIEDKIYE